VVWSCSELLSAESIRMSPWSAPSVSHPEATIDEKRSRETLTSRDPRQECDASLRLCVQSRDAFQCYGPDFLNSRQGISYHANVRWDNNAMAIAMFLAVFAVKLRCDLCAFAVNTRLSSADLSPQSASPSEKTSAEKAEMIASGSRQQPGCIPALRQVWSRNSSGVQP